MKVQYDDACLSLQEVYERTRKFINGIRSDENAAGGTRLAALSTKRIFF
jgi:hypothetical protein